MLRKIIGLVIATARGDVPARYIDTSFGQNAVLPVPAAPAHLCWLGGCQYTRKITRSKQLEIKEGGGATGDAAVRFDRLRPAAVAEWTGGLLAHIAAEDARCSGGGAAVAWAMATFGDEVDGSRCSGARMRKDLAFAERVAAAGDSGSAIGLTPGAFCRLTALLQFGCSHQRVASHLPRQCR